MLPPFIIEEIRREEERRRRRDMPRVDLPEPLPLPGGPARPDSDPDQRREGPGRDDRYRDVDYRIDYTVDFFN